MARRRRKNPTDPVRRDLITSISSLLPQREPLRAFEDRREFHFDYDPLPEIFMPTARASIIVSPRARSAQESFKAPKYRHEGFHNPPSRLAFTQPARVAVCVRREQRREVIFAKKKAGRGARQRKPRWNALSSYSCKR